jgi:hypothetical protein
VEVVTITANFLFWKVRITAIAICKSVSRFVRHCVGPGPVQHTQHTLEHTAVELPGDGRTMSVDNRVIITFDRGTT